LSKKESRFRSEARERRRAESRRQSLVWNIIVLGGLGLFLTIVVVYTIANMRPGPLPGEMVIPDEGQGHLTEGVALPAFHHDPPSSGTHYPKSADWGLATTPVPPSIYLHNLGIGGVVFLYQCTTPCPDLEKNFQDLYTKTPPDSQTGQKKVLITQYDKPLPSLIVALAWDHQLNMPAFNEATMLTWYKRFVNMGPEPVR
jgi:hypothetical protein